MKAALIGAPHVHGVPLVKFTLGPLTDWVSHASIKYRSGLHLSPTP